MFFYDCDYLCVNYCGLCFTETLPDQTETLVLHQTPVIESNVTHVAFINKLQYATRFNMYQHEPSLFNKCRS